MLEESHHLELPKDSLGADQTLENVGQFLESHPLAISRVSHGPDDAEGAVADGPVGLVVAVAIVYGDEEEDEGREEMVLGQTSLCSVRSTYLGCAAVVAAAERSGRRWPCEPPPPRPVSPGRRRRRR